MPTFRITGDDPERTQKIALRRLATQSQGPVSSFTVDEDGAITVIADRVPSLPPRLTVEEVDIEVAVEASERVIQVERDAVAAAASVVDVGTEETKDV
jgi:hypothetical protein